ncbi:MAG: glycine cleavage T-protein [Prochlorococcus sp.]
MSNSNNQRWDALLPLLRLEGSGSQKFLHGQTSADLMAAEKDSLLRSCWLSATGRLRALLEIRLDKDGADVLVLTGNGNSVAKGFEQVIFPADQVRLQPINTIRRLQTLAQLKPGQAPQVSLLLADEPLPKHWAAMEQANTEQVERWRLKQGLPLEPGEINGDTNPFELGLAAWVSLSKGCYLGQETLAKLANSGGIKQQLRYWQTDSPLAVGQKLITRQPKEGASNRAGVITSAMQDPESTGSLGLALVRHQSLAEPELFEEEDSTKVCLSIPSGFEPPSRSD